LKLLINAAKVLLLSTYILGATLACMNIL